MSSGAAQKLHAKFYPLFKDLFLESNPIPVKAALAIMGLIDPEIRLPLTPLSTAAEDRLRGVLRAQGLLT